MHRADGKGKSEREKRVAAQGLDLCQVLLEGRLWPLVLGWLHRRCCFLCALGGKAAMRTEGARRDKPSGGAQCSSLRVCDETK